MARKVVGKISREMNREMVNYSGPKTPSGAKLRNPRKISAPPSEGVGPVYRDEEDI
ncbi:MAG: hypothetical protein ACYC21_11055 [Eubacteriales bacterium]